MLHTAELASWRGGKDAPLPEMWLAGNWQQLSGLQGFTLHGSEPDSSLS